MTTPPSKPSEKQDLTTAAAGSWRSHVWPRLQLILAVLIAGAVLVVLIWSPFDNPGAQAPADTPVRTEVVQVAGPRWLRVQPGSYLDKRLVVATVETAELTDPLLTVTGHVVASLRPGDGPVEDRWQFATPELLTAYTDWRKAVADVAFTEKQLAKVRDLDTARIEAQKKVVERFRKLVAAGTDTPKDLAVEETNLIQYQIQGQKEVHEAETAVHNAERTQAALARHLLQSGVDPVLLGRATSAIDMVIADVPEGKIGLARLGQGCRAKFYGYPGEVFPGKVVSVAPVVAHERRTLRVLFTLDDPQDQLKPGMFADIGLGTDRRAARLVPAESVLHIGQSDYVLVGEESGTWRVVEVTVGEQHGHKMEIREGLRGGERVVAQGAILLKPAVVRALQADASERSKS